MPTNNLSDSSPCKPTLSKPAGSLSRSLVATLLAGAMTFAATTGTTTSARAEGPVTAPAKGMIGGGLLGAELGLIITAAIDPEPWWPYLLAGVVGAGAGVAGGYAVEQVEPAEPSLYMLAGGMALIIPTVVIVVDATAYDPEEEMNAEEAADPASPASPDAPAGGNVELTVEKGARRSVPNGLIAFDASGLRGPTRFGFGVPVAEVRNAYTAQEIVQFGVTQVNEVHVPIIAGRF